MRKQLSSKVADSIRSSLLTEEIDHESFLPTERELGEIYNVSRVTVRKALLQIMDEGLVEVIPHQGYKPITREKKAEGKTIAFFFDTDRPMGAWESIHEQIFSAFSRTFLNQGCRMISENIEGKDPATIFKNLKTSGVWGIVIDSIKPELLEQARMANIPVVLVDAYINAPGIDNIIQDNFNGARLATEYLIAQGHKRIGWVGPTRRLTHFKERFAGAQSAMYDAGLSFDKSCLAELKNNRDTDNAIQKTVKMLDQKNPPTAILSLWQPITLAVLEAAKKCQVKIGKDLEIVAWTTEQEYYELLAPEFKGGTVPATMIWKPEEMAKLAITMLKNHDNTKDNIPMHLKLNATLKKPRSAKEVLKEYIELKKMNS